MTQKYTKSNFGKNFVNALVRCPSALFEIQANYHGLPSVLLVFQTGSKFVRIMRAEKKWNY